MLVQRAIASVAHESIFVSTSYIYALFLIIGIHTKHLQGWQRRWM